MGRVIAHQVIGGGAHGDGGSVHFEYHCEPVGQGFEGDATLHYHLGQILAADFECVSSKDYGSRLVALQEEIESLSGRMNGQEKFHQFW